MPLLTKDGKPYKLFSAPNPLVKEQILLPRNELIFHNMKSIPSIVNLNIEKNKEDLVKSSEPVIKEQNTEEIVQISEIEKIDDAIINVSSPVSDDELNDSEIPQDEIVITHCQIAYEQEIKDSLYGEVKKVIKYGEKYTFESYIVEVNDLEICIYTKKSGITKNSILYPSKYKNGKPMRMLRWWKVKNIKQQNDEYLIFGEVTSEQRSF